MDEPPVGKLHDCDLSAAFAFGRAHFGELDVPKGATMTATTTAHHTSGHRRSSRIALIHAGAVSAAFVSGTFALMALLFGSPFEYGSALALCGAAWIVAHLAERFAEQERARHRREPLSKRRTSSMLFAPGYLRLGAPAQVGRDSSTRKVTLSPV